MSREQLISENVRKYQDVSLRLHNEEVSYRTLSKYQTLPLSHSHLLCMSDIHK